MSNIGYAVFGSPKGLLVESNGLFKSLNLDKSLYLNNTHVDLNKGEQVLMIRRIPSNLNNLEKKDALLIALYEKAFQHGNYRPGGFVGSAICFKDKMPNAEEIISGLVYLFSKMKENVDADNRFKSIDASNWNISLPDANKKFGLEDTKLNYALTSAASKNIILKLNNLDKEAASLLYNFALNRSFHSVDYLYASTSNALVEKMKPNGFLQVLFAEFFNYNNFFNSCKEQLNSYKEELNKASKQLDFIEKNATDLQKTSEIKSNEVERLKNHVDIGTRKLKGLESEIEDAKAQLSRLQNQQRQSNTVSSKEQNRSSYNKASNGYLDKYNALNDTVTKAANTIRNHTSFYLSNRNFNDNNDKNKQILEGYFKALPKRQSKAKKRTLAIFSILLILLLTFAGLLIWKANNFDKYIKETKRKQEKVARKNDEIKQINKKSNDRLNELRKFKKGSKNADYSAFKKIAKGLLNEYLANKTNKREITYINDHIWEFYEFDYTNDKLVEKLAPGSKLTYFISSKGKTIKPLKAYLRWQGESNIGDLLSKYKDKNDNDIYEYLSKEVLSDDKLILSHFKWMIEKENKKGENLEKGVRIKLPFYDNKK
jgi:hypothetical protein